MTVEYFWQRWRIVNDMKTPEEEVEGYFDDKETQGDEKKRQWRLMQFIGNWIGSAERMKRREGLNIDGGFERAVRMEGGGKGTNKMECDVRKLTIKPCWWEHPSWSPANITENRYKIIEKMQASMKPTISLCAFLKNYRSPDVELMTLRRNMLDVWRLRIERG